MMLNVLSDQPQAVSSSCPGLPVLVLQDAMDLQQAQKISWCALCMMHGSRAQVSRTVRSKDGTCMGWALLMLAI